MRLAIRPPVQLSAAENVSPRSQQLQHAALQPRRVHGIEPVAQPGAHVPEQRGHPLLAVRLTLALGSQAEHDLAGLGVGGEGGIHGVIHEVGKLFLHLRLGQAEDVQVVRDDRLIALCAQPRQQLVLGEVAALVRHARQQHGRDAARLEDAARRRADGVVKHRAPARKVRLLQVARGHLAAENGIEIVPDFFHDLRVELQPQPEGLADNLLRHVVIRRAEPAGKDEQVCAPTGDVHHLAQTRGVVADRGVVQHIHPDRGQHFR